MIQREESFVLDKVRCPKCAAAGKDKHNDNLAIYSDGHHYCFSCGYYKHGQNVFTPSNKAPQKSKIEKDLSVPHDAVPDLPFTVAQWLQVKYHFTLQDMIDNVILWSPKLQWLIFPIHIGDNYVGFQARNFNPDKPYKWFTKFPKRDKVKVYNPGLGGVVCIVEDIVSAIRVGHSLPTIPLFGSHVNDNLLNSIHLLGYYKIIFWLDSDKWTEMVRFAKRARELMFEAEVIHTKDDPKCYTNAEITNILNQKEPNVARTSIVERIVAETPI